MRQFEPGPDYSGLVMYKTTYKSPLGELILASDGENLTGLWIKGQKYFGGEGLAKKDDLAVFDKTKKWLDSYFAGKKPKISDIPLAPAGSDFRKSVLDILCDIPYGETVTYGSIAKKLGSCAQAVGGAVGHNPISIIIPCHRVVGTNGSLTGYAGGIDKKIELLKLEGAQ